MTKVKLLDCTLRDGGYYNDWDFDSKCVRDLVHALNQTGVEIVEMGYKSPVQDKFYGPYRYCPESQLGFLREYDRLQFSFMIDAKEFIDSEAKLNLDQLRKIVYPAKDSVFSWARVASNYQDVKVSCELIHWLHERGYQTCFNMMGLSLLSEAQIIECLGHLNETPVGVFYFADSFGSLEPADIGRIVKLIKRHFNKKIGIHTHDNQGLAFANCLAAMEAGVEYIDGTVTGMGRGAGNVRLEQLLLSLYFKFERQDLNVYPLLDVIQNYFRPMQEIHHWGGDFSYMLSGLLNIHPNYCQRLRKVHQYTMLQVAEILSGIPKESRRKFDLKALEEASNGLFKHATVESISNKEVPAYTPPSTDSVLVVGAGPSLKRHLPAIKSFIQTHSPLVIECNHSGQIDDIPRKMAILNEARFREICARGIPPSVQEVIIPRSGVDEDFFNERFRFLKCRIRTGEFAVAPDKEIVLPGYVVGMFATTLALLSRPKRIYLAGFDGLSGERSDEHDEMSLYWEQLQSTGALTGTELVSILPTKYKVPTRSIYGLLN